MGKGHPGAVNGSVSLQNNLGLKKRIFIISADLRRGRMCPAMTITGCKLAVFVFTPRQFTEQGAQAGISLEELPGSPFPGH